MSEENEVNTPNFEGEEMRMPENADSQTVKEEKSSVINGPLLFILALLLIVILGGMYYWFSTLNQTPEPPAPAPTERPTAEENNEPESTTAEVQTEVLETVSTSDELSAIEADLESTDLDNLDSELQAIDAELEAAIQ